MYETPLTDEELIETKTAYPELQQIFHKMTEQARTIGRIRRFDTEKRYSDQRGRRKVGGTHDSPIILILQWQEAKMEERTGASRSFHSTMRL